MVVQYHPLWCHQRAGSLKEKFFDKPIYAQAISELIPTKPEKNEETENPKKIHKELLENNEDGKKDPKFAKKKKGNNKHKLNQNKIWNSWKR